MRRTHRHAVMLKPIRYAITDRTLNSGSRSPQLALEHQARLLAAEGTDLLQLREKDLPAAELAEAARTLLRTLAGSPTKLLINGRADVAVAVRADGVHLSSSPEELTPAEVHALYAHAELPPPLITVSCHTPEDIARQRDQPITAILFGPVFEKVVAGEHRAPGTGLDRLAAACREAAPTPVLALGGVTAENTPLCLEAGAAGIAGIRLFGRR